MGSSTPTPQPEPEYRTATEEVCLIRHGDAPCECGIDKEAVKRKQSLLGQHVPETTPTPQPEAVKPTIHRYRFEISYLSPYMIKVTKMMNAFDISGDFGVQTDIVTFVSTSNYTPIFYREKLKEAYEASGCRVIEASGGEIV